MLNIQQNIPLAKFTTFKIGGPAKFFVEVKNEEELLEAVNYAKKSKLEIFILGGGSNILISDEGFQGLVIKLQFENFKIENEKIECGASVMLSKIVNESVKNELSGLEWAVGIPGTVGGAIRGNAGAYGSEIGNNIESINAINIERFRVGSYKKDNCNFSYRNSIFKKDKNLVIISCVMNLQKGKKNEIENKIREIIKKRSEKIPTGFTPGSFFQNPTVKNPEIIARFEKDTGAKCYDGKIPAGWLIEGVRLRGKKIGGASVSEKHGNFVINLGNATAQDVIILASFVKMKVRNEFGVQLKEEVQYVGF